MNEEQHQNLLKADIILGEAIAAVRPLQHLDFSAQEGVRVSVNDALMALSTARWDVRAELGERIMKEASNDQ